MAKSAKNLQIPFNCRRTYGRKSFSSVGSVSLGSLDELATSPIKRDGLLCCYNLLNHKYRDRIENHYHCDFGDVASHQTVFLIDIDNVKYTKEAAALITEHLSPVLYGHTPIVCPSHGGNIHVVIPADYRITQDEIFRNIVEYLVSKLPECFQPFVDKKSYIRTWSWYQSHNFKSWRDAGYLNVTRTEQGDKSRFFTDEAALGFGQSFLLATAALNTNVAKLSNQELNRYVNFVFTTILGVNIYGAEVCKDATSLLRRAVAEAFGRGNAGEVLSTIRSGKKALQRKAEGNLFSGLLNVAVFAIERICGMDAEVAHRDLGGGGAGSSCVDGSCAEKDDLLRFERDSEESHGDLTGSSSRNEAPEAGGLPDHSSVERVLAFVSEFEVLLGRQQFNTDGMGNLIPASGLRKHKYRSHESEKQDYALFDGVCGQILERYTGKSGTTPAAFVRLYEWFRYTSRHLGNIEYGGRSLHEIGNEIARRMRLSDAFSGAGRFQEVRRNEANLMQYADIAHLEELEQWLFEDDWQRRVGPEKYADRIASFVRNHPERFRQGLSRMLGFLGRFRTKFLNGQLDIGIEHFEHWFGSRELCSYFRRLILGKMALTSGEYAKGRKTMSWMFFTEVKDVWFPRFEVAFGQSNGASSAENFAARLGNGKTYAELCKIIPHLFLKHNGDLFAAEVEALQILEMSSANDKKQRKRDIRIYLERLRRDMDCGKLRLARVA